MDCPADVFNEVRWIAAEYSSLRNGFSKWRSFKYKTDRIPENSISLQEISDEKYFLIYSETRNTIQGILYTSVEKRMSIKQSRIVFYAIKRLWDLLNPFHLPGISKKVYVRLLIYVYFYYLNCTSEISQSEEYAVEDAEMDFKGEVCMGFVDFYMSVFEIIDYFTKSYLMSEYSRFLNVLVDKLEGAFWFNGLDLHNKLHIDPSCQTHMPWMLQYMKAPNMKGRNLLTAPNTVKVSQRLLHKPEHIIDMTNNVILEKRMNRLSRMQSVPIKYIVLNRSSQSPERSKRSRPSTRCKPPPKKIMRFRKNSHILEDVIERRKPQMFSKTQEIFFSQY